MAHFPLIPRSTSPLLVPERRCRRRGAIAAGQAPATARLQALPAGPGIILDPAPLPAQPLPVPASAALEDAAEHAADDGPSELRSDGAGDAFRGGLDDRILATAAAEHAAKRILERATPAFLGGFGTALRLGGRLVVGGFLGARGGRRGTRPQDFVGRLAIL